MNPSKDQNDLPDEIVKHFSVPPHPYGISLEGAYVRLEPLAASVHARELFEANSTDAEGKNWSYLPYGPFRDFESYFRWLSSFEKGKDPVFFAVVGKRSGKAAGVASYLRIKPRDGSVEVGHVHFSPLMQRTAEATEAMHLMMKWAFENGYRRYEWKCHASNAKSRKAAQRLGLSFEGVFRQMTIQKGRNRDTAWFAAIDKEWEKLEACHLRFLSPDNFEEKGRPKVSLSSLTKPLLYKTDAFGT